MGVYVSPRRGVRRPDIQTTTTAPKQSEIGRGGREMKKATDVGLIKVGHVCCRLLCEELITIRSHAQNNAAIELATEVTAVACLGPITAPTSPATPLPLRC